MKIGVIGGGAWGTALAQVAAYGGREVILWAREGAVVEYAYTVTSDFFFNLQDWTFQREIPVRWSEFRASIPEYFDYKMLMQGYYAPALQTKEESATQFTQTTSGGFTGRSGALSANVREGPSSETETAARTAAPIARPSRACSYIKTYRGARSSRAR